MAAPAGWTARIPITTNPASIPATMPDGGVSVFAGDLVIDEANSVNYEGGAATFIDGLAADYSDLVVTQSDGETTVPFGVKQFDQTGGTRKLIIGLGIPSLSSSVGTVYYLYRGCTGGPFENKAGVVPTASGFSTYWPLEESAAGTGTASVYKDWTSNAVHGDDYITEASIDGVVGNAIYMDRTSVQRIVIPDASAIGSLSAWTIMGWMRIDTLYKDGVPYSSILNLGLSSAGFAFEPLYHIGTGQTKLGQVEFFRRNPTVEWYRSRDVPPAGWHLWVVRGDATTRPKFRMDTTDWYPIQGTLPGVLTAPISGDIGDIGDCSGDFADWALDEIQLHSALRSDNWLLTYYNMTSDNDTFWTVGAEEAAFAGRRRIFVPLGPTIAPF